MTTPSEEREIVYVEREGSSLIRPFLLGAVIGAALGLLFAPAAGGVTRRKIQGGLRRARAAAEDAVDEVRAHVAESGEVVREIATRGLSARAELEQRLAEARARRRSGRASASGSGEPSA
jgi:gas vesicle protein